MTRLPERFDSKRLTFARPRREDLEEIFSRYAADPEVTKYVAWPTHRSLDDTRAFLAFSDEAWRKTGAGPWLLRTKADDQLVGSTGIDVTGEELPSTGYVLARDAWGQGFATEALLAVLEQARAAAYPGIYALVHPDNAASVRVLEKAGLSRQALGGKIAFPNLGLPAPQLVLRYALRWSRT